MWDPTGIRDQSLGSIVAEISDRIDQGHGGVAAVVNAHKLTLAEGDAALQKHLSEADWVLADGISIPLMQVLRGQAPSQRVCGIDLAQALVVQAAARGWRVGLLGGARHVIGPAAEALMTTAPGLQLIWAHHGYAPQHQAAVEALRHTAPQLLLVGLGSPRQEHFIHAHQDLLGGCVALGVGGSLDVWAGVQMRAPAPLRRVGLEWAWRVAHQPLSRGPRLVRTLAGLASAVTR